MSEAPGDLQTIDEIIALAAFEPDLRLLLVEGRGDASLFSWFLNEWHLSATVVAVNDRLFVTSDEVHQYYEDFGERTKLETVAQRVRAELPDNQRVITVLVDSDWTAAVGPLPFPTSCRLVTDFPSVEFYFMEPAPFRRFACLALEMPDLEHATVVSALGGALQQVASVRLVLHQLGYSCVTAFEKSCTLDSPTSSADVDELLRKSLNGVAKRALPVSLADLVGWVAGYHEMLVETNHPGRGHDIAPLLIKYLSLKNELASPKMIERMMRTTADHNELTVYPLFRDLRERFAA